MAQVLQAVALPFKGGLTRMLTFLERPLYGLKLNAEEIARRRNNRLEGAEENYLWCWQHRGFW